MLIQAWFSHLFHCISHILSLTRSNSDYIHIINIASLAQHSLHGSKKAPTGRCPQGSRGGEEEGEQKQDRHRDDDDDSDDDNNDDDDDGNDDDDDDDHDDDDDVDDDNDHDDDDDVDDDDNNCDEDDVEDDDDDDGDEDDTMGSRIVWCIVCRCKQRNASYSTTIVAYRSYRRKLE